MHTLSIRCDDALPRSVREIRCASPAHSDGNAARADRGATSSTHLVAFRVHVSVSLQLGRERVGTVFPDGAIEVRSVVLVAAVSAFAWFMVVAKATFAMSQVLTASAMVMILCLVLQSALLIEDLRG